MLRPEGATVLHIEFGYEAPVRCRTPPFGLRDQEFLAGNMGSVNAKFRCYGYRHGARLIPSLKGKQLATAKSSLKNLVFDVQPLRGWLILKNLWHR